MTCLTNEGVRREKAFTLVELLVALAIASIFVVSTLTVADMSIKSYSSQERVSEAQQSLRAALDLMIRDIRMAGYDPMSMSHGPTSGIGIVTATPTMLQVSADLNADQQDNGGTENLTYFYDARRKRLRQKEGGNAYAQTFIENVSAMRFSYFDADNEPTNDVDAIVSVVVLLTVENTESSGGTFEKTLTARVECRNLRM